MRHAISILLTLSLLATMSAGGLTALAQQSHTGQQPETLQDPFAPGQALKRTLPAGARIGSTPERQAAWDKATPEQREKAQQIFNEMLAKATQKATQKNDQSDADPAPTVVFTDKDGKRQLRPAAQAQKGATPFTLVAPTTARLNVKTTRANSRQAMRFSHAPQQALKRGFAALAVQASCYKSIEQFIRDFYQGALARQPNAGEFATWNDALAQAQAQGSWQLIAQAQDLGRALFQAQEYINRGRADRDYVSDLYKGYLQREPDQGGWDAWTNLVPSIGRDSVREGFAGAQEFYTHVTALCAAAADPDFDGLPNDFENRVADAFTPYYHVSNGDPDNFATFNDDPTSQTVSQRFNPYAPPSPVSHFRVTPLGFGYNNFGQLISMLRIDYLTLWDHDSGLVGGGACLLPPFGLNFIVEGLNAHPLDNERSAQLVAAPVSDYTYNLDPGAYSIYRIFTAAHEDRSGVDQSRTLDFSYSPVPAYNHINLALTQAKHGTYTFNPDYYPIAQWWIINAVYQEIAANCECYGDPYCYDDTSRQITCAILYNIADTFFFGCAVEHFGDSGGRYANLRINVGEPDSPINGSRFIQTDELHRKLIQPTF